MNFDLTDDQKAFVQTARAFAEAELAPNAARWDAEHHFPVDVIRRAGELGFCGIYSDTGMRRPRPEPAGCGADF